MKEYTWKEVIYQLFFTNKGLKDIRAENGLIIPDEYNNYVSKLFDISITYLTIIGFLVGWISHGM